VEFVSAGGASFSSGAENTEENSKKKENSWERQRQAARSEARVTEARAKRWKMDRQDKGESREDEKKTARGWANGLLAK